MLTVVLAGCSLTTTSRSGGSATDGQAAGPIPSQLTSPSIDTQAVKAVLDARAAAVTSGDAAAYLSTVDPIDPRSRKAQAQVFTRLQQLSWSVWNYTINDVTLVDSVEGQSQPHLTAQVRLDYKLGEIDTATAQASEQIDLIARNGTWYVTKEESTRNPLLWQVADLTVLHQDQMLVIGIGPVPVSELKLMGQSEAAALNAVQRVISPSRVRRAVIIEPANSAMLGTLLDRPADSLSQIAAVTTTGTGDGRAGADRVWINRQPYLGLAQVGQEIVLRHETTHLVMRAASTSTTPMWLEEGFAEFIGYHNSGVPLSVAAGDVLGPVANGQIPSALPAADVFDGSRPNLGVAYHQAWTACLWLAEQLGTAGLVTFYDQVAAGTASDPESNVDAALAQVGLTRTQLIAGWRASLKSWAAGGSLPS